MRFKILASLFFTLFANSSFALTVISDLDDTIKITRVNNVNAVKNSLLSTKAFLGMPELMRSYKAILQNRLYIVSGSPNIEVIEDAVEKLLRVNYIEVDGLLLVTGAKQKPEALARLIQDSANPVVLIGDDQEHDPAFYQAMQVRFPGKIAAVYIHQLNKVKLPPHQIGYLSAYEVAVHEATAGRLGLAQVEFIQNAITQRLNRLSLFDASELLIPEWQKCDAKSVRQVLAKTRVLPIADQQFLNRIEQIAIRNCED